MPEVKFESGDITSVRQPAGPALIVDLRLTASESVERMMLQCQLHIDAPKRRYSAVEQGRLHDLFGDPERWSRTMRSLPWGSVSVVIPRFQDRFSWPISIPCDFDFHTGPYNFFRALDEGSVPLSLLFRGTIFYRSENGDLRVQPISWNTEANAILTTEVWRQVLNLRAAGLCPAEGSEAVCLPS